MSETPLKFSKRKLSLRSENLKDKKENIMDTKWQRCKSIDLDEICQFSAARQRALEKNAKVEFQEPFKDFVLNRVFINHVDSFNGRILADYLSEQSIDISRPESVQDYEEEEFVFDEESENMLGEREAKKDRAANQEYFEIIGTVDFMKNPDYTRPESVREILDEQQDDFLSKIFTCGYIIYDISSTLSCHPIQIEEATCVLNSIVSRLENAQNQAPKLYKNYKDCRTFILISTVMTWAKTKPIDPNDPELPFTERDYRKRKPHPNYKIHCEFEKKVLEIGKKFPDNLRTIVVGSGVTYGHEEDVLHFLFKRAWLYGTDLPLFKPGNNKIPLIHVNALATVVHKIMANYPPSIRYIIAVEQSPTTLKTIVKLISRKLGNGKVMKIDREKAFTYDDIKQKHYDMLTINLNIIPGYIFNNMELKYDSELTFSENIDAIIAEFRNGRKLKPVKIFIHGPPASGKTFLSQRLANFYRIHHLHAKLIIEGGIRDIKERILQFRKKQSHGKLNKKNEMELEENEFLEIGNDNYDDDDDFDDYEAEEIETLTQFLNEIEDSMDKNENRLEEKIVLRLFKEKMLSNPCQNQGYIIDGYPKDMECTKLLYEPDEEQDDVQEREEDLKSDITKLFNKKIMPDIVVCLDASDEYLIGRVIKMPQILVENGHYAEEEMCRRLMTYRLNNTEENTLLIYFDELEIPVITHNIENENDSDMNLIFEDIVRIIGAPKNYEPQPGRSIFTPCKEKLSEKYMEDMKSKSNKMIQERRLKMENWMFLKNQEKEMEERALALLSLPLRHYLMKYIFPTLTRGLVEVAKVRPQDPVDYLAEFLFKENPEGKMFQPDYDNLEDELGRALRLYEDSLDMQYQDSEALDRNTVSGDQSGLLDAISNVTEIHAKCSSTSASSKTAENKLKDLVRDDSSSGSCKCVKILSEKSSSTSSASTPPLPQATCMCPPYSSHPSYLSSSSSADSDNISSQDPSSSCRCNI